MASVTTEPAGAHMTPGVWRRWVRAAGLILRGRTWRVALPIALVVGTALSLVNEGAELVAGVVDADTAFRLVANYSIPYVVSSVSQLSVRRDDAARPGADRTDS